eukprot:1513890-Amphidinium_carterae.1
MCWSEALRLPGREWCKRSGAQHGAWEDVVGGFSQTICLMAFMGLQHQLAPVRASIAAFAR